MENCIFGNLKDWGLVLEKMEKLAKNEKLGEHQSELIRVLRFDDNWRLREAAIECLEGIENPSPALVDEVYAIMMREDLYYDVRILAAYALGKSFCGCAKNVESRQSAVNHQVRKILEGMNRLMKDPQPPLLHKAIRKSIEQISG